MIHFPKRPLLLLFAFCAPLLFGLSAQAAGLTPEQVVDLKRVSAALNKIQNLQGHFLQIGPDGGAEMGTFYMRKPGRVRFEYNPPNPTLIVSDTATIAVQNTKLHTTDRYPLTDSPLRLLLSTNVDLSTDPRIVKVSREPGLISLTAREASGPAQGEITITLSDPAMELKQWEVLDAQGLRTLVTLNDVRSDVETPARLFVIQDQTPFQNRKD